MGRKGKSMERKNPFSNEVIVAGYPRTGTTFLSFVLKEHYGSNIHNDMQTHTIVDIEFNFNNSIIVAVRHPLDSISSWVDFRKLINHPRLIDKLPISADVNYYIRFYSYVLSVLDRVVLFDFNKFTTDLDYTTKKLKQTFNIEPLQILDIQTLKDKMLRYGGASNLPRKSYDKINAIKELVIKEPRYQEAVDIYNKLLSYEQGDK